MYLRAQTRTKLTTYLFSATFLISVFTVGAPNLLPCPANNAFDAETKHKDEEWKNKRVVISKR
uniref:ARAD1A12782p n=1 Tax=Blastobotrys adeninivorans TaxID=409370 RepID=A0A060SXF5_BLAAD